jgi:hypothetical protein
MGEIFFDLAVSWNWLTDSRFEVLIPIVASAMTQVSAASLLEL